MFRIAERFFRKEAGNAGFSFLLVGLGNPGPEYRYNRHNVGFMIIDRLAQKLGVRLSRFQSKALYGTGNLEGRKIILAKPHTYMNLSGQAVAGLARFYKMPFERLLVIHDDIDIPLGTIRLRPSGGSAGQKGLDSIIRQLGTQDFPRLRFGVGRPPGRMSAADYVLQNFPDNEQDYLEISLERAAEAAQSFVISGLDAAMNQYNGQGMES